MAFPGNSIALLLFSSLQPKDPQVGVDFLLERALTPRSKMQSLRRSSSFNPYVAQPHMAIQVVVLCILHRLIPTLRLSAW